ncbi:hypothetical protein CFO_g478 [Ceratocystis platani]|uniref:Uncharacterized protein n=1 Tax=Ceratocystis fimbriata f. sp. platani TaxID=88771 RepID=A0A0F8D347_CERFI|nr:hypothetical protein CFO_g478 [Ceratocystis platani]
MTPALALAVTAAFGVQAASALPSAVHHIGIDLTLIPDPTATSTPGKSLSDSHISITGPISLSAVDLGISGSRNAYHAAQLNVGDQGIVVSFDDSHVGSAAPIRKTISPMLDGLCTASATNAAGDGDDDGPCAKKSSEIEIEAARAVLGAENHPVTVFTLRLSKLDDKQVEPPMMKITTTNMTMIMSTLTALTVICTTMDITTAPRHLASVMSCVAASPTSSEPLVHFLQAAPPTLGTRHSMLIVPVRTCTTALLVNLVLVCVPLAISTMATTMAMVFGRRMLVKMGLMTMMEMCRPHLRPRHMDHPHIITAITITIMVMVTTMAMAHVHHLPFLDSNENAQADHHAVLLSSPSHAASKETSSLLRNAAPPPVYIEKENLDTKQ